MSLYGKKGFNNLKSLGTSNKYKHVYKIKRIFENDIMYRASITKFNWHNLYITEREAGIAVDVKLIEKGFDPVNVLKKKK